MASPTEAECIATFKRVVKLYEETRQFAETNSTDNWVDLEDALVQGLETDFPVEHLEPIAATRSRLNGMLRDAAAAMGPPLRQWAKTVGITETNPVAILMRLHRRMVDTSNDRVASRAFTFASPSAAGGNVGNGVILRLNKDRDNFDIESQHPDAKIARCIADMNTGAERNEEVFEFLGGAPSRDALKVAGSGAKANISAYSARDSMLGNPSFSLFSGTISALTDITNWTALSGNPATAYELSETYYYRDFVGDDTPRSLIVKGNDTLYQRLRDRQIKLLPDVPYVLRFAYNRNLTTASAVVAGSLVAHFGGKTTTIDLSTGSGWQLANVPTTIGQDCWPSRLNEDDLDIKFVTTGISGAERVAIDDVLLVPGIPFDSSWYWVFGGSTRWLYNDSFTWTDSCTDSVIQRWLWRAFGLYLPHSTGGGITISDP